MVFLTNIKFIDDVKGGMMAKNGYYIGANSINSNVGCLNETTVTNQFP